MDIHQSLDAIRKRHQEILQEYDRVLLEVKDLDVLQENQVLRKELTEAAARYDEIGKKYRQVAQDNQQLTLSLKEQILDEKFNILKVSREKLRTYFASTQKEHEDRLTSTEKQTMAEIDNIKKASLKNLDVELEAVTGELADYAARLREVIRCRREEFNAAANDRASLYNRQLAELEQEPVSPEVIRQRLKQNEIEMKIGLNWVNKLGIILILFGVGAAAKYSFATWFNDYMKGALIFLLGGLLLATGEWFYRKGKDTFATGLLGGGIAVLYCGIFYSYFLLKIIGLSTGLGLSALVTVTGVALAVRYRSQTICALGLIGGYLPFFSYVMSIGLVGDAYYSAMGYLFMLNLAVMLVSFRQKWSKVNYVSMVFHLPALVYLVFGAASAVIGIVYSVASFATYLGIILAYPLSYRQGLGRGGVILLGVNTVASCTIIYSLFGVAGWSEYNGLLALGFCLIYTALGSLVSRIMPSEKYTTFLFYSVALSFAVLMVPFQFGVRWMSLGWLVEGIALIGYGLRKGEPRLEKSGLLIFAFCLASFYLVDWLGYLPFVQQPLYFDWKYFAVIAGMVLVTRTYLADLAANGSTRYGRHWDKIHLFKYFTIGNVWIYLGYLSGRIFDYFMIDGYYGHFYRLVVLAIITLVMAYCLPRVPLLRDKVVYYFSLGLYLVALLICVYINLTIPLLAELPGSETAGYVALAILAAYNLLGLLVLREVVPAVLQQHYLNFEIYPLVMLVFLLGNITAFLTVQFQLENTNLAFSLIYLFTALAAIKYGFIRKFVYCRRVGLGLSLLATTKLFIFDLAFLTSLYRIFAYFCFGFVLLGISYLYQHLKGGREDRVDGENL